MKIHWFFKFMLVVLTTSLVWVTFYFILPKILPKQEVNGGEIYGLIFSDQVWQGDIKVVGDIFSPTNNTVTVMPGTKITVAINGDKSNMDLLPWHRKSGVNTGLPSKGVNTGDPFWDEAEKIQIHLKNVQFLGEADNPIIVKSDSIDPSPYDFNVLRVGSGKISNTFFTSYRRFEIGNNVMVSDSTFRDIGECAICIKGGKPKIENNVFENSEKESIWVEKASPEINNNLFRNLIGDGIKIDSRRLSVPNITNNVFEMPQGVALNIISGGQVQEGLISRNIFSGNSRINIACDSKVRIRDNVILGLVSFSNGCNGGFIFGPNFWGTKDTRVIINEKILGKYEKFIISIPNVLISPPKDAGRK